MWYPLLKLKRNGLEENCIFGRIAWHSPKGIQHSLSGESLTYIRSLAKPIQMKCIAKELDSVLTAEEKAISISSHSGESCHVKVLKHFMNQKMADSMVLKATRPYRCKNDLEITPQKIFHNCSGKHSAILKACVLNNWPIKGYNTIEHPYYKAYLSKLREYLGASYEVAQRATDGCRLPTIALQMNEIAKIYASFSSEKETDWIWQSMSSYPELIGGKDRIDSLVIKSCHGEVVAKEGADGLLGLSIVNKEHPEGLGIVIKLANGRDERAMNYIAQHILKALGYSLKIIDPLAIQIAELSETLVPKEVL